MPSTAAATLCKALGRWLLSLPLPLPSPLCWHRAAAAAAWLVDHTMAQQLLHAAAVSPECSSCCPCCSAACCRASRPGNSWPAVPAAAAASPSRPHASCTSPLPAGRHKTAGQQRNAAAGSVRPELQVACSHAWPPLLRLGSLVSRSCTWPGMHCKAGEICKAAEQHAVPLCTCQQRLPAFTTLQSLSAAALSTCGPTLCQFLHSSKVNQLLQVTGVATARKQQGLQRVAHTHAMLLLLLLGWCQALQLLQQVLYSPSLTQGVLMLPAHQAHTCGESTGTAPLQSCTYDEAQPKHAMLRCAVPAAKHAGGCCWPMA